MSARVASHRRTRTSPRTRSGATARTAGTLVLASAATAAGLSGAPQAAPRPTPAQVKERVERLYEDAEKVTEQYNGTREKARTARRSLDALRDEAARRTARLITARTALGAVATAQYRTGGGDPSLLLALSARPGTYLERAALLERAGSRQAARLAGVRAQLRSLGQVRGEAGRRLADLRSARTGLRAHKRVIEGKLAAARRLLATLDPAQRAAVLADGAGTDRASRDAARAAVEAPNSRAARAVAFAYEALGSPYLWGATGPGAFDCSGLTQAAWRSAGVALPRTTFTQVNAGTRVPRSRLAPGDLVFFYPGLSHVGLYIGGGRMIHAPHPGAAVRVAPVGLMPFAAAVRPA